MRLQQLAHTGDVQLSSWGMEGVPQLELGDPNLGHYLWSGSPVIPPEAPGFGEQRQVVPAKLCPNCKFTSKINESCCLKPLCFGGGLLHSNRGPECSLSSWTVRKSGAVRIQGTEFCPGLRLLPHGLAVPCSDLPWPCSCDSAFWLLSFWITLPLALYFNSIDFSMCPVQIPLKEGLWLVQFIISCEAVVCWFGYRLTGCCQIRHHPWSNHLWQVPLGTHTITGDAISGGTMGGHISLGRWFGIDWRDLHV